MKLRCTYQELTKPSSSSWTGCKTRNPNGAKGCLTLIILWKVFVWQQSTVEITLPQWKRWRLRARERVPELIPVLSSQPAGDRSHKPGSAVTFRQARSVTFPAAEHHRPLADTKLYCLVTEARGCEQLVPECLHHGYTPTGSRTRDR